MQEMHAYIILQAITNLKMMASGKKLESHSSAFFVLPWTIKNVSPNNQVKSNTQATLLVLTQTLLYTAKWLQTTYKQQT